MTAKREDSFYYDRFPEGFLWGLASSAYQIEGAWNTDGRGESIWDRFCKQNPDNILDKSNGDIACDSYHKYKEDVQLIKNMGAKMYRFSISWTRILPRGNSKEINNAGVEYYNKLIDELLSQGIEPVATIYHWDLPQALEDEGGWLNEKVIVDSFGKFARLCFDKFGDRVKRWITINEVFVASWCSYEIGQFAPGLGEEGISIYLSIHNMQKAHAVAYHIYQDEFKLSQKGTVGISLDSWWYEPADPNSENDCKAAERAMQFRLGLTAHPILKGDYPAVVKEYIDRKSKTEGRVQSRLPILDQTWTEKIRGSYDFIGLNHYTTQLVQPSPAPNSKIGWSFDQDTKMFFDSTWLSTGAEWQRVVPWGLRKLLCWIKNEYDNPEIIITENGLGGADGEALEDTQRVEYYRLYINEMLKAIKIDGCNVTGYCAWSLLDVFEWNSGHTLKFGVHHVDFEDPERKRTPKASAKALARIFEVNGFLE